MEINFYFSTKNIHKIGKSYLRWDNEELEEFWGYKWAFQMYFLFFELQILYL